MRSRQLETALTEFLGAAADHLRAEVAAGAEVPFELGSKAGRRGHAATPLYCYRALTGQFIGEREAALKRLPGHAEAAKLLERFDGLDRYLTSVDGDAARAKGRARVRAAIKALLEDVFDEQTDFELRPERLQAGLERLQQSELANASEIALVATLHGLTIASGELPLASGLRIAQRDALTGVPEAAVSPSVRQSHASPYSRMSSMIGSSARPLSVSAYSTRGGTSPNVWRSTIASSSSPRRRRDRVRGLMPASERSSSQKRERPSDSSRTSRRVHLPQTISAVRHTGHVSSTAISIVTLPTEVN